MWKKIFRGSKKTPKKEKVPAEPNQQIPNFDSPNTHNNKLLICDDAYGNRLVLKRYFQRLHHQFDEAQNGKEAIELVKQNGEYQIIWIDVKMPIMNGIECTNYLRQHGYQGIIIGITGFTDNIITSECISVGMTHVITKPITQEVLIMYLEKYAK